MSDEKPSTKRNGFLRLIAREAMFAGMVLFALPLLPLVGPVFAAFSAAVGTLALANVVGTVSVALGVAAASGIARKVNQGARFQNWKANVSRKLRSKSLGYVASEVGKGAWAVAKFISRPSIALPAIALGVLAPVAGVAFVWGAAAATTYYGIDAGLHRKAIGRALAGFLGIRTAAEPASQGVAEFQSDSKTLAKETTIEDVAIALGKATVTGVKATLRTVNHIIPRVILGPVDYHVSEKTRKANKLKKKGAAKETKWLALGRSLVTTSETAVAAFEAASPNPSAEEQAAPGAAVHAPVSSVVVTPAFPKKVTAKAKPAPARSVGR